MSRELVLIETYWNVNPEGMTSKDIRNMSINRNILECK